MHTHSPDPVESVKCQLAGETLRVAGCLRLRVTGSSMLPAVWPGDVLHVRQRDIQEVRTGDIAVFECYGRLVAHRVVEHRGSSILAQGDTLPQPDPPVTAAGLLGIVTEIVRRGKRVSPSPSLSLPRRITAALMRRSSPASKILQRVYALRCRAFPVTEQS